MLAKYSFNISLIPFTTIYNCDKMAQIVKYLKKKIKKYSEDIAYIIVVGIPSLLLSFWIALHMNFQHLY
jgi:hypothetical protein